MKIENQFEIPLPPDDAFGLLVDVAKVAPCFPGATLGADNGDGSHAVRVTVKFGPMRFVYDGTVSVTTQSVETGTATLVASAKEARGQGAAKATIDMTVVGDRTRSTVKSRADIEISGRAAQMGHGMVETVTRELVDQMARCLEHRFGTVTTTTHSVADADATPPPIGEPIGVGSIIKTVLARWLGSVFRRGGR